MKEFLVEVIVAIIVMIFSTYLFPQHLIEFLKMEIQIWQVLLIVLPFLATCLAIRKMRRKEVFSVDTARAKSKPKHIKAWKISISPSSIVTFATGLSLFRGKFSSLRYSKTSNEKGALGEISYGCP